MNANDTIKQQLFSSVHLISKANVHTFYCQPVIAKTALNFLKQPKVDKTTFKENKKF